MGKDARFVDMSCFEIAERKNQPSLENSLWIGIFIRESQRRPEQSSRVGQLVLPGFLVGNRPSLRSGFLFAHRCEQLEAGSGRVFETAVSTSRSDEWNQFLL